MSEALRTARLELVPMTVGMVEAVLLGRRDEAEAIAQAEMPARWPNRELIERAFALSLDGVRAEPERYLWGARVVLAASETGRRVVGSIVFHGGPDRDGISEIAYGIEEGSQGRGYATEAVGASVHWALAQPPVVAVQAATFAWHRASLRVIEKIGMKPIGTRDHETLGEMLVFERRGPGSPPTP
jgi:[ribosomal protein S5]-alanine N-acetyltransferase